MQLVDMARSLLNTMVIDGEGEEFEFKNFSLPGVKDIIDESCNMLSAVTSIPQTVLFGRSPAGENATGESDLTNYYDFVGLIQETNVTDNLNRLVGMAIAAYKNSGRIEKIPDYHPEACPLWNLSDLEQAQLDQAKAGAAATKAQTAQIYVDMQALDAGEVRKTLAKSDDFQIDEILSEEDLLYDELIQELENREASSVPDPQEAEGIPPQEAPQAPEQSQKKQGNDPAHGDKGTDYAPADGPAINIFESGHFNRIPISTHGCGVYIVDNGRILCGTRADNNLVGGPGGHVEPGETPIFAAVRETMEEFGIVPENLVQFGYASGGEGCIPSTLFVCTDYIGSPRADGREMKDVMWLTPQEIDSQALFPAFRAGTEKLIETVLPYLDEHAIINKKINVDYSEDQPRDKNNGQFAEAEEKPETNKKPINKKAVSKKLMGEPNSIKDVVNKKGGIDRNLYDENGRQFKQLSNNDHGKPKGHPYGSHGEHAHDYIYDNEGNLVNRTIRALKDEEKEIMKDIL